jgi:predicted enzyme related to lactoylglutathione lyase
MSRTIIDPFVPRVGGIMSADIAVPQHELEVRFYASVLSTGEDPLWLKDLMNNRGVPVIGLGARSEEYADLPLQWMPHIQVADVAKSVECALELGGTEVLHGRDNNGKSLWAVLLDPNGAAFGLIPVVSEAEVPSGQGATSREAAGKVGCITWLNLTVANATETRDFYQKVIGWSVQDVEMEDASGRYADYNMLGGDGTPAAGISQARGVNTGLPPVWMLYLPVGDIAESLLRVRGEGGKVIKAIRGADGEYANAVVQDPVGVCLALVSG